jgi:hypothetical protein
VNISLQEEKEPKIKKKRKKEMEPKRKKKRKKEMEPKRKKENREHKRQHKILRETYRNN